MANIGVPVDPVDGDAERFSVRVTPVGASLLAKAIYHSISMLKVLASSRAGSLPQGICSGLAGEDKNDKARTRRALGFE